MKFASALTTKKDPLDAIQDLVGQVRSELGPEKTDLALLFVHPEFLPQLNEIYEPLRSAIAYNPRTDTWRSLPGIPTARAAAGAVTIEGADGCLRDYVHGGTYG